MSKPFFIGVAGGSGSGKTTVVTNLTKVLKNHSVLCISHDDYYRDQDHLPMSEREKTNYDHPDSLETDLLVQHLKELAKNQSVHKPTYDFLSTPRYTQHNNMI